MNDSQLLKGVLDLAVLAVVSAEDGYGYDIVRRLRDAGLEDVADASVYGTLRRLFRSGKLSTYVMPSEAGPARRYYGITKAGVADLAPMEKRWRGFVESIDRLLSEVAA